MEEKQIISRKEAREQNLEHYFTGEPCKYNHISERKTRKSDCLSCLELQLKIYKDNHVKDFYSAESGLEIVSKEQAKEQGLKYYFTALLCKYGHISERKVSNSYCMACVFSADKDNHVKDFYSLESGFSVVSQQTAIENGDKFFYTGELCIYKHNCQRRTKDYQCNLCERRKCKIYNEKHNEQRLAYKKQYHADNVELERNYRRANLHKGRFNTAKRIAAKLERTPKWSDMEAIKVIYENCPEGDEVDHIYPLQGKLVSGLHVPENLQYLLASKNRSKQHKFTPLIIINEHNNN